jgi:hypothetical protein
MAPRPRRAPLRPTALHEPATTGNTPGSPNGAIAPTPGTEASLTASLTSQYVSAGGYQYWSNYARSLPHPFDDLTQDLGVEIYQSMQYDGVIKAALTVLVASSLEDSVNLLPAVDDDDDPDQVLGQQITDFCAWVFDNLTTPLDTVLWDMMWGALAQGSRIAEQTYALRTVAGVPRLVLTDLKVKPQRSTAFVVDAYNDVLGLVAIIPGVAYSLLQTTVIGDLNAAPNLLPREKFAILSFRPVNNDPRGTSILRAAYAAWWHKMQMWPEYLRYLTQFASPLPVGTTAPDAIDTVDPATGILTTPEMAQLAALQGIRNGSAISQPFGATVTLHYSAGAGEAFISAIDQDDRQMSVSILGQLLATGEGRHQARAAAQVHQDILDQIVRQLKLFVTRMITRDILTPLVRYNFGPDAADRLVPGVNLGETETSDQSKVLAALAVTPGFTVLPSQLQEIYQFANLPQADASEIAQLQESRAAGLQAAQQVASTPPDSTTGTVGMPNAGGSTEGS